MIKKMIKGEKGFTLVELLAVIVILGIIVAIAIPAIGNVISKAQDDADKAEITMIIDAARLYQVQELNGAVDASFKVTVAELKAKNYLDERQGEVQDGEVSVAAEDGTDHKKGDLIFTPGKTTYP